MAEERSEGATTEGPSVTSTVDTNARLPRLGTPSDRIVGGGAGAASNLPRAWVTSSASATGRTSR
jgi:hypothetical protein